MGFVGNKRGPRKSVIVDKLGPEYFDISPEELEVEIQDYKDEEFRGVVDPVYVDARGLYYLVFFAPGGKTQKFYLKENGYELDGDILIEVEERSR